MDQIYRHHEFILSENAKKLRIARAHLIQIENDLENAEGEEHKLLLLHQQTKQNIIDKYEGADDALVQYQLKILPFITRLQKEGDSQQLLTDFVREVHPELENKSKNKAIDKVVLTKPVIYEQDYICPCGSSDMIHEDGVKSCSKCGLGFSCQQISTTLTHSELETSTIIKNIKYKRLNHFRETLHQLQGTSRIHINKSTLRRIKKNLASYNSDMSRITLSTLQYVLSKSKLVNWREKLPFVAKELNCIGIELLVLSAQQEQELCTRFSKLEAPYNYIKCKVLPSRKSFMSYPFVTYKLCELLGYSHTLKHFKFLKSYSLFFNQERWWKLVCYELGWEYIPTQVR